MPGTPVRYRISPYGDGDAFEIWMRGGDDFMAVNTYVNYYYMVNFLDKYIRLRTQDGSTPPVLVTHGCVSNFCNVLTSGYFDDSVDVSAVQWHQLEVTGSGWELHDRILGTPIEVTTQFDPMILAHMLASATCGISRGGLMWTRARQGIWTECRVSNCPEYCARIKFEEHELKSRVHATMQISPKLFTEYKETTDSNAAEITGEDGEKWYELHL